MEQPMVLSLLSFCVFTPAIALAGTCVAPTPVPALNGNPRVELNDSTCGGEAGINMGGTIYGHPSQVYSFTANNANGNVTITGTDREMSLTTSCTSAPVASGAPSVPIVLGPGGVSLTSGTQYLLIVSTDPSVPLSSPPVCGGYSVNAPFPVSLQQFSVD